MQALKKINNNFALCLDSNGVEMIAYGKGVGFGQFPCEIPLDKIQRTYYDVNPQLQTLLQELPEEVFQIAAQAVFRAQAEYNWNLNSNMTFSLADHINFAIKRIRKGLPISFPFSYDVEHLYEKELALGRQCVTEVWDRMRVRLPKSEAVGIALHFINNYQKIEKTSEEQAEQTLEDLSRMAEEELGFTVDHASFNYYRFASHIRYLLKRIGQNDQFVDVDKELYQQTREAYPDIARCSDMLVQYLNDTYHVQCTDGEQFYLIIHLNRLKASEDA